MSCPWVNNREKKSEEKTLKYAPPALGIETAVPRLRGATAQHHHRCPWGVVTGDGHYDARDCREQEREVLRKIQKAVLSGTLNIAQTFKVAT